MYNDIDAMFDRFLQVRRPKRRVDDRHYSRKTPSKLSEFFQVQNCVVWITRRLSVQNLKIIQRGP